ncbi:hypothetical protein [Sulfitobacter faviae]|uniref:hypothetical protein n=1 Tax=Sulfitobacter faviae TaxID=1775881 RepID=UPI002456EB7D|nr:hypothetical protein [Sulfitobacter faviae]
MNAPEGPVVDTDETPPVAEPELAATPEETPPPVEEDLPELGSTEDASEASPSLEPTPEDTPPPLDEDLPALDAATETEATEDPAEAELAPLQRKPHRRWQKTCPRWSPRAKRGTGRDGGGRAARPHGQRCGIRSPPCGGGQHADRAAARAFAQG